VRPPLPGLCQPTHRCWTARCRSQGSVEPIGNTLQTADNTTEFLYQLLTPFTRLGFEQPVGDGFDVVPDVPERSDGSIEISRQTLVPHRLRSKLIGEPESVARFLFDPIEQPLEQPLRRLPRSDERRLQL